MKRILIITVMLLFSLMYFFSVASSTALPEESSFDDISPTMHFFPYIEAIYAEGITTGYGDNTYRPDDPVTRGQMARFLVNARGLELVDEPAEPSFDDAGGSIFFLDIETIYAEGITGGVGDNKYGIDEPVTRGQMAAFIARAFGLVNAEINPTEVGYDLANPDNVETTITWNFNSSVESVSLGGDYLADGDYIVENIDYDTATLTISQTFFDNLDPEAGTVLEFTIEFDVGNDATLIVLVGEPEEPIVPPDPEIDEIDVNNDVEDINVPFGTSEADAIAILAEEITISDTDEDTHVVSLDWSIEDYDGDSAGDYDATGTFELPEGVAQTDPETDLEVEATVTVSEEEPIEPDPLEVVSVEAITDTVTVPYGTSEAEAIEALDDEVEFEGVVEDEDNVTLDVVDWTAVGEYDGDTADDYTFEGEAQLPENNYVWGEDVETTVTATVTVLEEPTYTVTFNVTDVDEEAIEGATVNLDDDEVVTNEDGEAVFENLVAGTYGYSVSKDGYLTEDGEIEVVDDDVDEEVTLVVAFTLSIDVEPENSGTVTGSGEYAAGEEVSITADPADGYVFFGWSAEINGFADAEAASTIFTMPAEAATITAYFAPEVPQKPVYNVDKNEGYDNISDAVSDADPNNKILVKAGNYEELVTIDVEGLTLKSVVEHGAVIDGGYEEGDYVYGDRHEKQINITADNVTLDGFNVINAYNGIFVDGKNVLTQNNMVQDVARWSLTINKDYAQVENNVIKDQGSWGEERQPRGLFFYHGEHSTLRNNELINAGLSTSQHDHSVLETHDVDESNLIEGKSIVYLIDEQDETITEAGIVWLIGCENITVDGVEIHSVETAVLMVGGSGNTVMNSVIGGGEAELHRDGYNIGWRGIIAIGSENNTIQDNEVLNARGGIEVRSNSHNNEITGNLITESRQASVIRASNNTVFKDNTIQDSAWIGDDDEDAGLLHWAGSEETVIEDNTFNNNSPQVRLWDGNLDLYEVLEDNTFEPTSVVTEVDGDDAIDIFGETDYNVLNIDKGKGYMEIQAAIDAAEDGDTIQVYPETYEETVTIDVPNLTLQAVDDDGNVIDATEHTADPLVTVDANEEDHAIRTIAGEEGEDLGEITVEGFTVINWKDGGITLGGREGTFGHVLGNYVYTEIEGVRQPIQITGDGSTVIGNEVKAPAILSEGWTAAGILAVDTSNTLIQGNTLYGNDVADTGIAIGNYWDGDYSGLATENNTIDDNKVSGADAGIMLQGAGGDIGDTTITNNELEGNYYGIDVQTHSGDVGDLTITGNKVESNDVGLAFYDWGHNEYQVTVDQISNNTFSANDIHVEDAAYTDIDLESILAENTYPAELAAIVGNTIRDILPENVYNLDTGVVNDNIQEVIDHDDTADGHTILVGEGEYDGFHVNKSLTIKGGTINVNSDNVPGSHPKGIYITGTVTVVIDGVTIQNGHNFDTPHARGIVTESGSTVDLTVKNSTFVGGTPAEGGIANGMYCNPTVELTATGNTFANMPWAGIAGAGMVFLGDISGNTFAGNDYDFSFSDPKNPDTTDMDAAEKQALADALHNDNDNAGVRIDGNDYYPALP